MGSSVVYDIIIAGNGSLAMSVAFALARAEPHLRLAIIGPKRRDHSASLAAGAMLGQYGEITRASLFCPIAKQKCAMAVQASKLWPAWLDALSSRADRRAIQLHPSAGTFVVNLNDDDAIESENFAAIRQVLINDQEPFEELAARDVRGVNREVLKATQRALFVPSERAIQPESLLAELDAALVAARCVSIDAQVEKIEAKDRNFIVETSDGRRLSASKVVVATGAGELLASLPIARNMPQIFSGVGVALEVRLNRDNLTDVVRTPNRGFSAGFHVVPRGDGCYYIGATNRVMVEPGDAAQSVGVNLLLSAIPRWLSEQFTSAELVRVFAGRRPVSADLYPLLGATSIEGLYVATGTGRDGLFLSPYIGLEMAQLVLSGRNSLPEVFAPERKLLVTMTRSQGIEAAVNHILSAIASGGLYSPGLPENPSLAAVQDYIEDIYCSAGLISGGVPPELLDLYRQGVIRRE